MEEFEMVKYIQKLVEAVKNTLKSKGLGRGMCGTELRKYGFAAGIGEVEFRSSNTFLKVLIPNPVKTPHFVFKIINSEAKCR